MGFITPAVLLVFISSLKGGGQGGRRRLLEGGLTSGRRGGKGGGRANYICGRGGGEGLLTILLGEERG